MLMVESGEKKLLREALGEVVRATLADTVSRSASHRPTRFAGWGPIFAQSRYAIGPSVPHRGCRRPHPARIDRDI
jgi:hypothetical protein